MPTGSVFRLSGAEEGLFMPTADGWLFSAPQPWPFQRRPTYRVTEAQKAALTTRLRRSKYLRLFVAFLFVAPLAAIVMASPRMQDPASPLGWTTLAVFVAGVAVACTVSEYLMVSRPLRGLRPVDLRITFGDRLRMQAEAMSMKTLVALAALFLFALAQSAYHTAVPMRGYGYSPIDLAADAAFAFLFLRMLALILVKLALPRREVA